MSFMRDTVELKPGLVIFRRTDVKHVRWYCRQRIPELGRYKTTSLKVSTEHEARDLALKLDAETRLKITHDIPVFDRKFSDVAQEFLVFQKQRIKSPEARGNQRSAGISHHRWRVMASHIKTQLSKYVGDKNISSISFDDWNGYEPWRHRNGKGVRGGSVSDGTIRDESQTFRAIMRFAAEKRYVSGVDISRWKLIVGKAQREEFSSAEYNKLHRHVNASAKKAKKASERWCRQVIYNFILIMVNTGLRRTEAANLRWKDIALKTDRSNERKYVVMSVWGKNKRRNAVATEKTWSYFQRIREISNAAAPDDYIFTTISGARSKTLYGRTIRKMMVDAGVLYSSSGKPRSTYSFRHTYAVNALARGVDVYMLSEQMGTSVQMIQDHYGHVDAVKNRDQILKGIIDWDVSDQLTR